MNREGDHRDVGNDALIYPIGLTRLQDGPRHRIVCDEKLSDYTIEYMQYIDVPGGPQAVLAVFENR